MLKPLLIPEVSGPEGDERLRRKRLLAAGMRLFASMGLDEGAAGHITVRDPEEPEHFWVNPFGLPFALVTVSDLLRVDHEGTVVEGDGPLNSAAFAIHSSVHSARPDIVAAAHSHSLYGKVLAGTDDHLLPLNFDACAFFEDHARFEEFNGTVLNTDEGKRIAHALGDGKLVILSNHGLLTVGESVESALYWFVAAERAAQVQAIAMSMGRPLRLICDDDARRSRGQLGTEVAGRFQGATLLSAIFRNQPGLVH